MTKPIEGWDDVLDSRDVLARVADLQEYKDDHEAKGEGPWSRLDPEGAQELCDLEALVAQLRDVGGDSPEDGQALIREDWLGGYVKDQYEDCTDQDLLNQVKEQLGGPWRHVDWEAVANDERSDYTPVTFRDVTYYVR